MSKINRIALSFAVVATVWVAYLGQLYAQSCNSTTYSYTENFATKTYMDPNNSSVTGWGGTPAGGVRLNYRAGGFPSGNPNTWLFNERVYATLGGDFTGDGNQDILAIALDANNACTIDFFTTNGAGTNPTNQGSVYACTTAALLGTVMAAGDVNNDGRLDFVYAYVTSPSQAGTIAGATLFINTGTVGGVPVFTTQDLTSMLQGANVAWHMGGNQLALTDWNKDGRADLFALSSYGSSSTVWLWLANDGTTPGFTGAIAQPLISPTPMYTPFASSGISYTGGYICEPGVPVSKGGTMLAVADFTGDGLKDIYLGSVNETNLYYYIQNTDGSLTQSTPITFGPGGPQYGFASDIDLNGTMDLVIVRSGNDCGGNPPEAWVMFMAGASGFDHAIALPMPGGSVQFATMCDMDHNGTPDIITGKINGNGPAQVWNNTPSTSMYALLGQAQSKTLTGALNGNTTGVVAVTMTIATGGTLNANNTITMYVSNNGGSTWDQLTAAETAGTQHNFGSFGYDLRWRAALTAGVYTPPVGSPASVTAFSPGANSTPILSSVSINYLTVPQGQYSRSALAEGSFTQAGNVTKDFLYSAAFQYPGFQGYLYAYDISSLQAGTSGNTSLQQVSGNANIGVTTAWEAGSLLASMTASNRTIYGAAATFTESGPGTTQTSLTARFNLNASQFSSPSMPAGSPNLTQLMGVTSANGPGLLNFIVGGLGNANSWKFLDPGHSSPVFVGAPSGDNTYGAYSNYNYSSFMTGSAASRTPIVLIGANDGMLHAFNAATGVEVWAFVPYNLLASLKNQVGIDPNSGNYYYIHQPYVDGTIQVGDVLSGGTWHTIAVVGEGQGVGKQGNHFYFAVDITNTLSPIPLWEFADYAVASAATCNGNPCTYQCTTTCTNSIVNLANTVGDSQINVAVNGGILGGILNGQQGVAEGEIYDTAMPALNSADYWNVVTTGAISNSASAKAYIQSTGTSAPCPASTTALASQCAALTYRMTVQSSGSFYLWLRINSNGLASYRVAWGIDGTLVGTMNPSLGPGNWQWVNSGATTNISAGDHTLYLWMVDTGVAIDEVAVQNGGLVPPGNGLGLGGGSAASATPVAEQDYACTPSTCSNVCLSNPNNQEWPQCGVGSGMKCCEYSPTEWFCSPVSQPCGSPNSSTGQTWSKPAIGPLAMSGGLMWTAFFGSGYNDRPTLMNVGRSVYAIDAYKGTPLAQWNFPDVAYNASNPNIDNAVPGSPTLVDSTGVGYIDRLYIGDLMGRMWKIITPQASFNASGAIANANSFKSCVVFDAGNPNQQGSAFAREWAPIITRPAAAMLPSNPNGMVNLYFGTGGDDRAPNTTLYKFFSVIDADSNNTCALTTPRSQAQFNYSYGEWIVGDGLSNAANPVSLNGNNASNEGTVGDRYWADPIIVNNDEIYFASLAGSIESVNPCLDLLGSSKLYGYAIQSFTDGSGQPRYPGNSLFGNAGSTLPWLAAAGKIRQAALLRNQTLSTVTHGKANLSTAKKNDVFIQQFSGTTPGGPPTVSRIADLGTTIKSPLRVLRWREILPKAMQ